MKTSVWPVGRSVACSVVSLALMCSSLAFIGPSSAQEAAASDPGQAAQEQALVAASLNHYTDALALAQKAASLGHPMEKDQVDYFTQRAAREADAAAAAARFRAAQEAAAPQAEQIKARQQKDYAERARRAALAKECTQQTQSVGALSQGYASSLANSKVVSGGVSGAGTYAASASPLGGSVGSGC
jgi:colicin import membrane protein